MRLEYWGETDVGLKRQSNQDTILIDPDLGLYVVADGMGGHKGGEVASSMAVETVQESVTENKGGPMTCKDILTFAFREASARIHHKSTQENPELMGMGTTMVAVYHEDERVTIANVGDSRAYLVKGDLMWQITEDHSLVNEQVRAGVILPEDISNISGKNVITRSIGFERDVEVDVFERILEKGESLVLCSDGLSGLVSDQRIAEIVTTRPPQKAVESCIAEAKAAGGDDNISVLILHRPLS